MPVRVLLLYYSYSNQTRRVAETMGEVFRERGTEVQFGEIQFRDERYHLNFPLKPFWRRMLKLLLPQLLGRTGEVRIDPSILEQKYDLICIGSPTWFLYPAMPVVSFLKSDFAGKLLAGRLFAVFTVCRALWRLNLRRVKRLATSAGGEFVDSAKIRFRGSQVRSMLSLINYLQNGEDRQRFLGLNIHPFGVTDDGLEHAKAFADGLLGRIEIATGFSPDRVHDYPSNRAGGL